MASTKLKDIPQLNAQKEVEKLFSKYQLLPVLREQFKELVEEYPNEEDHEFLANALAQIYLHRQADVPTMVGILSPRYGTPQEVADKLLLACELDYLDFDTTNPEKHKFVVKYDVSKDIQEELNNYQYPLPMITKPNKVKNNTDTGYETIRNLIVLNGSEYFKDKDMCLDHINRVNSVALSLDMKSVKSEEGKYIVPTRNIGEDFVDFRKRMKQSSVFYDNSLSIMEGINQLSDKIYLTHRYDRRGRTYCSGYHINSQGTDYNKAVLQLHKKELVK